MNRKQFFHRSMLVAGAGLTSRQLFSQSKDAAIFTAEEITELVFAAHSDLEKTQKIVDAKPLLLNCTNQFKKGDFETAIGGASHMGRKDIADFLVSRGARLDIFNLTFLGHTELVKGLVEAMPDYLVAPGPHGFTLLHHAEVGDHTEFAKWLKDQGLTETRFEDAFKTE